MLGFLGVANTNTMATSAASPPSEGLHFAIPEDSASIAQPDEDIPTSVARIDKVGSTEHVCGGGASAQEAPIGVGCQVKISGVQSRPLLNGMEGTALEHVKAKERWKVKLTSGASFSFKSACLSVVAPPSARLSTCTDGDAPILQMQPAQQPDDERAGPAAAAVAAVEAMAQSTGGGANVDAGGPAAPPLLTPAPATAVPAPTLATTAAVPAVPSVPAPRSISVGDRIATVHEDVQYFAAVVQIKEMPEGGPCEYCEYDVRFELDNSLGHSLTIAKHNVTLAPKTPPANATATANTGSEMVPAAPPPGGAEHGDFSLIVPDTIWFSTTAPWSQL